MYGGSCQGEFCVSLLSLTRLLTKNNIDWEFTQISNNALVQLARNRIATEFLSGDYTHLLFIDADISFRSNDALKMINADVDVIGGIYPKKEIHWEKLNTENKNDLYEYTFKTKDNTSILIGEEKLVEVEHLGCGLMLIKKEVLLELTKHVKKFKNDLTDDYFYYNFFDVVIDDDGEIKGEDVTFCRNWIKIGGKIYAAAWAKLGHLGNYKFGY